MFNMLAYIKYPFAHRTCTYTQGRANSWGTICRNRPGVPITDVTIVSEFLKSSQEHKMNSIPFCLYGCHFKLVQIMKLTIPLPPNSTNSENVILIFLSNHYICTKTGPQPQTGVGSLDVGAGEEGTKTPGIFMDHNL